MGKILIHFESFLPFISKNVETEKKDEIRKDAWKDLSLLIMEEKFKAEERKEIIGEEWRKISKIFDRFLLVVFTLSSFIATICCIMMSPHFPETRDDESGEDDVFDQDDAYEDFTYLDVEEYKQNYSYSFYTLDS